jgi:hypothetical protein
MKIACLIISNVWLIIVLVLMLGKTDVGTSTDHLYTFFNVSQRHSSSVYNGLEGVCLFIAVIHFLLAIFTQRKA